MTTYLEYVRETMQPRKWGGTALLLLAISTPLFLALFLGVSQAFGALAGYGVLFLWGWVDLDLFASSRAEPDVKRKLIRPSGWYVRDVPLQALTGTMVIAVPVLIAWIVRSPGMRSPDTWTALGQVAFFWVIVGPVETWVSNWVWPIVLPFGPAFALVAWIFLHGERASDPWFFLAALALGSAFFGLTLLRYVLPGHPDGTRQATGLARFFGPVAGSCAHATWDTLLIWAAFQLPTV